MSPSSLRFSAYNATIFKLPSRVGPKVSAFGTILLKDDLGNKMAIIRKRVREDPEEMAMEVLREG